jgi:hypothetical protein
VARHAEGLVLRFTVSVQDGHPECAGLELDNGTGVVRAEDLRRVPLRRLIKRSALSLVLAATLTDDALSMEPTDKTAGELEHEVGSRIAPRRRPRKTGASLTTIVEIYRREIAAENRRPRRVIAEEMGWDWPASSVYIGQRLVTARKRKMLGPAPRGKAAEL